jgi:lysophospholipase L1-like esterase
MVLGGLLSPWLIAHLSPPTPLNPARWTVLVPGRNDGLADANLSNGTGLVDGSLLISQRSFGRSDLLMPKDSRPIGELEISLTPTSGPLYINCRNPSGFVTRIGEFAPGGWRTSASGGWTSYQGPIHIGFHDQQIWVDGAVQAVSDPGTVELTPSGATAQIQSIRLWDTSHQLWMDEDFSAKTPTLEQRLLGAMGGGLVGALFVVLGNAGWFGILLLLPAVMVLLVPYPEWRVLAERLYLVRTAPGILRISAFLAGFFPLLAGAFLASGHLSVETESDKKEWGWGLILLGVSGVVCRDLGSFLWAIPGFFWLLLPYWTGIRSGQSQRHLLLRDLPALLLVAGLGWGPGFLPALLWRLIGLLSDTRFLLEKNPRAGTDLFWILLASFPLSLESGIRSTYLREGWDSEHLKGASIGSSAAPFSLFWSSVCGNSPPTHHLYAFGGSSTGGAYQFKDDPSAFFVAQLQERLCAKGHGQIVTYNYGDSGRDSWDISQAAPALFQKNPPRIVLYYGGVNDLLTRDAPLSRKQRAAALAARSTPMAGLDALGSSSRLLTGIGLLVRPPENNPDLVVAVPLEDAEENLRALAKMTAESGGDLVLVPEYAEPYVAEQLRPYWAMEERLSKELPHVQYVDLYGMLAGNTTEELLADRNHLTRIGSMTVADRLLPVLEPLLVAEGSHE